MRRTSTLQPTVHWGASSSSCRQRRCTREVLPTPESPRTSTRPRVGALAIEISLRSGSDDVKIWHRKRRRHLSHFHFHFIIKVFNPSFILFPSKSSSYIELILYLLTRHLRFIDSLIHSFVLLSVTNKNTGVNGQWSYSQTDHGIKR